MSKLRAFVNRKLGGVFVLVLFGYACFFSVDARAHGEDKPGPHGGIIRMPGALHTEVLPLDKRTFRVYLLDMNFEYPMTRNSTVKASVKKENNRLAVLCEPNSDFFDCILQSGKDLENGELVLEAVRDGVKGAEAEYTLPLKLIQKD